MIFFEVLLPLTAFCFCFNLYLGMPLLREKLRRVGLYRSSLRYRASRRTSLVAHYRCPLQAIHIGILPIPHAEDKLTIFNCVIVDFNDQ